MFNRNHLIHTLLAAVVGIALLAGVGGPPPRAEAGGNVSPRQMLSDYYININAKRFDLAYAQWSKPTQTYTQFAAGYVTTTHVDSYFGGFQPGPAGTIVGRVPGVLVGYHADGSQVAFSGCYELSYQENVTGAAQWMIAGANFKQLSAVPYDSASVEQLLKVHCYARLSAPGYYDFVQQLLVDYYDAINRRDYVTAYNLWSVPQQSYTNFVNGWQDTADVVMFYGNYQYSGSGAADTGRVPVVLFGYRIDGSLGLYGGCFRLKFDPAQLPQWKIAGANLRALGYVTTPDKALIQSTLNASCYGAG